jgi:hypothetical protein
MLRFTDSPIYPKIYGEFERDAAPAVVPGANGAGPLQCLIDLNSALGREEAREMVALPATKDVIRRFNRDTERLARGILGAVVSAALVVAPLIQEGHPKAVDQGEEERQTSDNILLNSNPDTLSNVSDLSAESSADEITSRPPISVDHGFASLHETPSPRMQTAASTQTPVLALTPEINQPDLESNAISRSPASRPNSARVTRPKNHKVRGGPPGRLRFVNVKMRLIALWDQSLARAQRPRSWAVFSNSNKGEK